MSFTKLFSRAMSNIKTIQTDKAPAAIGPYSQAKVVNGFVYTSGQIPLNAKGDLVGSEIQAQTKQSLENLSAVLEAAGSSLEHVVKTTVFLKNMNDFAKMNEIYASFFPNQKPARSAIEVARLPKDVLVEVECVAVLIQ